MRLLAVLEGTTKSPQLRQLETELAQRGVLIDVVMGAVTELDLERVAKADSSMPVLCLGRESGLLVPRAVEAGLDVIVVCETLQDWYTVSAEGWARLVSLFVFFDEQLRDAVNRNVNYVLVRAGAGREERRHDLDVLVASLENLFKYPRTAPVDTAKWCKSRAGRLGLIRNLARQAHQEEPSFLEVQLFLDALHTQGEREKVILNLPGFIQQPPSAQEIRGFVGPGGSRVN